MKQITRLLTSLLVLASAVAPVFAGEVIESSIPMEATLQRSPVQICIAERALYDLDGRDIFQYRAGQYAFTGERMQFIATVRDPNGLTMLGHMKVKVVDNEEVICNPTTPVRTCDGFGSYNPLTDQSYVCHITVEPNWDLQSEVKFTAYDTSNQQYDGTRKETWDFNPALALSVETNDQEPLQFEVGTAGDWVHSTNNLVIRNLAEGGVNVFTYIAGEGTGLWDEVNPAKCPTTNVLEWHLGEEDLVSSNSHDTGVAFRAWSGTQQTQWTWMNTYNPNAGCDVSYGPTRCFDAKPIPAPTFPANVLTNGGTEQVEFKIHYPVPCVGNFNSGSIKIIAKAV